MIVLINLMRSFEIHATISCYFLLNKTVFFSVQVVDFQGLHSKWSRVRFINTCQFGCYRNTLYIFGKYIFSDFHHRDFAFRYQFRLFNKYFEIDLTAECWSHQIYNIHMKSINRKTFHDSIIGMLLCGRKKQKSKTKQNRLMEQYHSTRERESIFKVLLAEQRE